MGRADFDKFLQRKQEEEARKSTFDPQQQIDEWLAYLDELYGKVRDFLRDYVEAGSATIDIQQVLLNEEFSGPYNAPQLTVKLGSSSVAFRPIGTMLIGSKGRVDVEGSRGQARLVLVNAKATEARQLVRVSILPPGATQSMPAESIPAEWLWKIATPAPRITLHDLSEENFFDMILNVADA